MLQPPMGDAYTPGLFVAGDTKIVKTRRLPLSGNVLVEVGMQVASGDLVAKTDLPGRVHLSNLANRLGVIPQELAAALTVEIGATVNKGEVVAKRKSFFGLFTSTVDSPIDGTLESVSNVTGQAVFREAPRPVQIDAYIDGTISSVIENEGVVVEAQGALIQGIFGLGPERVATMQVVSKNLGDTLTDQDFKSEHKGKIVVGSGLLTLAGARRAMELEVAGVVCGGFAYQDVRELLGYDVGVAVTGTEKIPTTLVLTEGFGDIPMASSTFTLMKKLDGKKASINGATQIRAGVIRPEVVVPLKEPVAPDEDEVGASGFAVGARVRCIRAPHFGKVGAVSALPVELATMPSETKVRVVTVTIDGGQEVTVPRANVEVIEK